MSILVILLSENSNLPESKGKKKGEQGGKGETKRQIKGVTIKKEGIKVYQGLLKILRPIDS